MQECTGEGLTPDSDFRILDAERLGRAAAGDRRAFERFVVAHESAVLRYIGTRTADPEVAEDALQETFMAAWRSADTITALRARLAAPPPAPPAEVHGRLMDRLAKAQER